MSDIERPLGRVHYFLIAALLCLPPLCGIEYLDQPLGPYLEFPPTTKYIIHAPFNSWVFLALLFFVAGACAPFLYRFVTGRAYAGKPNERKYPFPWWGWMGIGMVAVSWVLAWNRFSFAAEWQRYTFTPLWLGYILVISGLCRRRQGSCLLVRRPRFYLTLFPASALFWWYFEYLNRFVQNWYYLGGGNISAVEYVLHATICFSTVLPAFFATYELLGTFPRLTGPFVHWFILPLSGKKKIGWLMLGIAVAALGFLAAYPDYLFPFVWIAPLLVIVGVQLIAGRSTVFDDGEKGDWRAIVLPALAALICGFFWEMWNWKSLAHWEYSIPFVNRLRIFAMPLPGYAGYLPFGLECLAVGSLLDRGSQAADRK